MRAFKTVLADTLGDQALATPDGKVKREIALTVRPLATGLLAWLDYIEARQPPRSGQKMRLADLEFQKVRRQLSEDEAVLLMQLRATLLDCFHDDSSANSPSQLREFLAGLERRAHEALAPAGGKKAS